MRAPELVEIELDGSGTEAGPSAPTGRRRTPWRRWVIASLALVLAGVLTAPPGGVWWDGSPTVAIGLLGTDMRSAPEVAWTTAVGTSFGQGDLALAGGLALVTGTGTSRVVDLASGTVVQALDGSPSCGTHDAVVCVTSPGSPDATVVTFRGTDAPQIARHPGTVLAVDVGDDLALVTVGGPQGQRLSRVAPDGASAWSVDGTFVDLAGIGAWAQLVVSGDRLTVGGTYPVTVDVATGDTVQPGPEWAVDEHVTLRRDSTEAGLQRYDVLVDGETVLQGEPVAIITDDALGGRAQLALGSSPGYPLVALDRSSGQEIWRSEVDGGTPVARVESSVLLLTWSASGRGLRALEEETGRERWRADGVEFVGASADTLLVQLSGEATLAGLDPVTGEQRWQLPLPAPLWFGPIATADGVVIGVRPGGPDDAGGVPLTLLRLRWSDGA